MQLSPNQKTFSELFQYFLNLHKIQNISKKKMGLGGYGPLKLQAAKSGVTELPKKPRVRTLMNSQHVKVSETLVKQARQYFCHIFRSLIKKVSPKNSVLVVTEILRLFVNILTPNDKYSRSKSECLTQPIQMKLSQNQKIFS